MEIATKLADLAARMQTGAFSLSEQIALIDELLVDAAKFERKLASQTANRENRATYRARAARILDARDALAAI